MVASRGDVTVYPCNRRASGRILSRSTSGVTGPICLNRITPSLSIRERLRDPVHPVVDPHPPVRIDDRHSVGIAVLAEPGAGRVRAVLVVQAIDRQRAGLGELDQHRVLIEARHAPGRPHVEQPDLAAQILRRHRLLRIVQARQREGGGRLVDEGRRHFARLEREAHPEEAHQHDEDGEREEEAQHSEIRSQKSEDRNQRSEVRRRKDTGSVLREASGVSGRRHHLRLRRRRSFLTSVL